ncbi:hypothetical protein LXA43DRAFT_327366 [Ganoderma leucocontextum]|nr:hypothetical protein LXA43DRAFT_327366 [Ganoderma leucocontextum]
MPPVFLKSLVHHSVDRSSTIRLKFPAGRSMPGRLDRARPPIHSGQSPSRRTRSRHAHPALNSSSHSCSADRTSDKARPLISFVELAHRGPPPVQSADRVRHTLRTTNTVCRFPNMPKLWWGRLPTARNTPISRTGGRTSALVPTACGVHPPPASPHIRPLEPSLLQSYTPARVARDRWNSMDTRSCPRSASSYVPWRGAPRAPPRRSAAAYTTGLAATYAGNRV